MIKLNKKTAQDFLHPDLCKELADAGICMDDAHYVWQCHDEDTPNLLEKGDNMLLYPIYSNGKVEVIPTYTLSELLYKLNECPCKDAMIGEEKVEVRELSFFKDAPFYCFGYKCKYKDGKKTMPDEYTECYEYPIESAAHLLIKCARNGIIYCNDVSDK